MLGIDVSYWFILDQSPDIHRTSIGHQELMSVIDLYILDQSSNVHRTSRWDVSIQRQILIYLGPNLWCPQDISLMSGLDISIWNILDNGADVPRPLLGRQFQPDKNRAFPDIQGRQVFTRVYYFWHIIRVQICQVILFEVQCRLHHKYYGYLHQINTIVITIITAIRWTQVHLYGVIVPQVRLFGYAIYSSADTH